MIFQSITGSIEKGADRRSEFSRHWTWWNPGNFPDQYSSGGAVPTAGSWLYFVDFVPGFICQICAPPFTGER